MRKLPLIIAFIFSVLLCTGQNINKAEYFIDTDPGFGLAIQIPITVPGNKVSLSFQVNTSGLSQGFHMMVLRAHDDQGHWSTTRQQVFYVYETENVTESNIKKAEYFIDTDPGFGLATAIPVTAPAKKVALSFNVNTTSLSQGFHMIVLRARDELGRWSTTRQQAFYVYKVQSATAAKINKAEYFIDSDPGFGKAVPVPVTVPGKLLSLSFNVNISTLPQGFHMIVLRAHDELGRWSNTRQQVFYVYKAITTAASNVTGIEYFIDTDPGFGKGTPVAVAVPGSKVTADFIVNLTSLTSGNHILYFRAKNALNRWGNTLAQGFSVLITGLGKEEVMPWFRMYPNPNEGSFILDFTDLQTQTIKITINDLSGRPVYSNELEGEIIPLSVDLSTGIYMLTVKAGDKSFMQKLVINR
ncbi:MAG: T9SS type A sorting domain-containing protein [Bacteroidales bacterium]|nr:T9SS type A sorting domain-containing protein [Bacteroidales bacterium]